MTDRFLEACEKTVRDALERAKAEALTDRPGHAIAALADGIASMFEWMVAVRNERSTMRGDG